MWWKKQKGKVIGAVLVIAVLAAAFWYGGDAPGLRGWRVEQDAADQTQQQGTIPEMVPVVPMVPDAALPTEDNIGDSEDSVDGWETVADPGENSTLTQPETEQDQYLTDPVPEGRPLPVEPQDAESSDKACTCIVSISCAAILNHVDWLDPEKTELLPEDGWILEPMEVTFYEGESVFNVLQRTCRQQRIHMEFTDTPMYNSAYIEGIHNLYEFDCGERSGWMYSVNGWFPNYGCSRYALQPGDVICWVYTCDLGADVGDSYAAGD